MTASHLCAHDRPEAVQVGPQHVLGVAGVEGVVHNHLQVGGPHHHVALHEAAVVVVVVWWVGGWVARMCLVFLSVGVGGAIHAMQCLCSLPLNVVYGQQGK